MKTNKPYIPPNAKKWLRALRSGKFNQIIGKLHSINAYSNGYCCLGVACEVALKSGLNLRVKSHLGDFSYNGRSDLLPPAVIKWLGFKRENSNGSFIRDTYHSDLAALNDTGAEFHEIADIVEEYAEQLFKQPKKPKAA